MPLDITLDPKRAPEAFDVKSGKVYPNPYRQTGTEWDDDPMADAGGDDAWPDDDPMAAAPSARSGQAPTSSGTALDDVADTALFLGQRAARAASELPGLPADLMSLASRVPGAEYMSPILAVEKARRGIEGDDSAVPFGGGQIREALHGITGGALTPREPRNDLERYTGAIADFAGASAVPFAGMAGKIKNPIAYLAGESAASIGGGIVQEAARDIDPENPIAPVIGAVAGSLTPGGIVSAGRGFTRGMTGAAGRSGAAADTIGAFKAIGTDPLVSQAAPHSGFGRIIERGLNLIPGSSFVLSDRVIKQAESAQRYVDSIVNLMIGTGQRSTEARAGRAIAEGIGQFINRFKVKAGTLYDEVDQFIPKGAHVGAMNTERSLNDILARGQYTPELQEFIQSPLIARLKEAIDKATAIGRTITNQTLLPYQTIKDLRTFIGSKLEDVGALTDLPRGDLKKLYGALSQDLAEAAAVAGPQAEKAFRRADRFYKAGRTRIDDTLEPIRKNRIDAEVFTALMNKDASRVAKLMSSLTPDQRTLVATEVFEGLGRAKSGQQVAAGNVFSFETFLTNYDKLGPEMRAALFNKMPQLRESLRNLGKVATSSREAKKFLPNPSGTAQSILQYGAAGSVGYALMAADVATAGKVTLLAYVGPYISAKMLTNPKFVRWLAAARNVPLPRAPGHLARLSVIARDDPGLVQEFMDRIEEGDAGAGETAAPDQPPAVPPPSSATAAAPPAVKKTLKPGQTVSGVMDGNQVTWTYKGGDPKEQASWARAPQ